MTVLKGTIQTDNTSAVVSQTTALVHEIMVKNNLQKDAIASIVFAITDDMDDLPVTEIMQSLALDVPYFSVQQFRYQTGMDQCIQISLHTNREIEPEHIFWGCRMEEEM